MQQADCSLKESKKRKGVHAQKHYSSQAFMHESSQVGGRKRDRKDRGQEADGKKDNPKKQKSI